MGSPSSLLALCLVLGSVTTSCAITRESREDSASTPTQNPSPTPQIQAETLRDGDLETLVQRLNRRIMTLEERLTAMDAKLKATQVGMENIADLKKPVRSGVVAPPLEDAGTRVQSKIIKETGFTNDPAIQNYRDGLIFFQGEKYNDSIIKFSTFLQKNKDHVLAGGAQFHIAEAYFKRGEYKLAKPEFERVLSSHQNSSYIPDTLKRLADTEDLLNQKDAAETHRQELLSLFPESPAARELMNVKRDLPQGRPTSAIEPIFPDTEKEVAVRKPAESFEIDEPPPTAPLPNAIGD